jgi:hypothetical protein
MTRLQAALFIAGVTSDISNKQKPMGAADVPGAD